MLSLNRVTCNVFRDVWNGSLQQGDVQCVQSTDLKKISGSETCGMVVFNRVTSNVFRALI